MYATLPAPTATLPQLLCYSPERALQGGNFAPSTQRYEHEWLEGPYRASWTFQAGQNGITRDDLLVWFNERMLYEVDEIWQGALTWRGVIWSMELVLNGMAVQTSADEFANAIKIQYTDPETNAPDHTGWFTHDESIARYGRFERIIAIQSYSQDEAEQRAADELRWRSSFFSQAPAYVDAGSDTLTVTAVGRIVQANCIYLLREAATKTPTTVSAELARLVEACDWLEAGWIAETNDTLTLEGVTDNTPIWDRMVELARLADSEGNLYRLRVDTEGHVFYEQMTADVDYYRYPQPPYIRRVNGSEPTWDARPGIIQHIGEQGGAPLPDSYLFDDRSLTLIERVSMRAGAAAASFLLRQVTPVDYYGIWTAHQDWMDQMNPEEQWQTLSSSNTKTLR